MDSDTPWTSRLSYIDLDVEIGAGSGRRYPVKVRSLASGEAQDTMRFPFVSGVLDAKLKDLELALYSSSGGRRRINSAHEQTVQDFGEALFTALFTGEVRSMYTESLREAERQGKGLRLRLHVEPPQLASLPWEFLYDARQAEYLCLSTRTPLVRYPDLPQPTEQLKVTPPLRILGMVVSARDLAPLDVDYEKQRVEEAVKELRGRGMIELTWLEGQTWRHLQRAMRRGPWHVFHFIGHGGYDPGHDEGLLALANDAGYAHLLRATELGRLLDDHAALRLVLLNSCEGARGGERDAFSGTAAALIRRGLPAVLAMQYEISDDAAIEFSRAFYEAVADGMPLDAAVSEARTSMSIAIGGTLEWGTPVLYMRSPDGRIFDVSGSPPTTADPPGPTAAVADLPDMIDEAPSASESQDAPPVPEAAPLNPPVPVALDSEPEQSVPRSESGEPGDDLRPEAPTARSEADERYDHALAASQAGRWDEAISQLEYVQSLDPGHEDASARLEEAKRQRQLAALYAEARQRHMARDWPGVLAVFDRICAKDQDYPDPAGLQASARSALAATVPVVPWWRRPRNLALGVVATAVLVLGIAGVYFGLNDGNDGRQATATTPTAQVVAGRPTSSGGSGDGNLPDSTGAMFGADLRHTGVFEAAGEAATGQVKWKVPTGGEITRPPVVVDGVVYFGSNDRHLYAFDTETGEERWRYQTEGILGSTPAVAGGTIYVGSNDDKLHAVDIDTREAWTFLTRGDVRSSPAVSGGLVYFGSWDHSFYAVDIATRQARWTFPTKGPIYSSPAISGGMVFFGSNDGNLYARDALTGEEAWTFETGGRVASSPAIADGVVYVGSHDGHLYAVDEQSGKEKWRVPAKGVQSSPAVVDGVVYFGSFDGRLYAVSAADGSKKWRYTTGELIGSSPTIGGGLVYFGTPKSGLYALDAKTGEERWVYGTNGKPVSSPAIVDGMVYIGSHDNSFYAIK